MAKRGKGLRLDKFLKSSRLIKRRTLAKAACDAGWIRVNGKVAKAGTEVKPGDRIEIQRPGNAGVLAVVVQSVIEPRQASQAVQMYRVVEGGSMPTSNSENRGI